MKADRKPEYFPDTGAADQDRQTMISGEKSVKGTIGPTYGGDSSIGSQKGAFLATRTKRARNTKAGYVNQESGPRVHDEGVLSYVNVQV